MSWVEENVEETLTYYRLPRADHKHMTSTNMLERLHQELKRRSLVVRIFPNTARCLRPSGAPAIGTHEGWLEALRYLNMEHLREHKKHGVPWPHERRMRESVVRLKVAARRCTVARERQH